ncbi:MAG: hypothetical protein IK084_04325 [Bacteroidaceae bacterium]|nr:hypothetical protein [Bacteroidaceae bacterium]
MDLKLNFKKEYNLPLACDNSGKALDNVFFKDGYAYASNAHILARVPLSLCLGLPQEEAEKLNGFCIPGEILKALYKYDVIHIESGESVDEETGEPIPTCTIRISYEDCNISLALARNSVVKMPKFEEILKSDSVRTPVKNIGVSVELMHDLSKALNIKSVNMRFTTADKKIYISAAAGIEDEWNQPIGIIMPVLCTAHLPGFVDE